jgi:hypothetical protein
MSSTPHISAIIATAGMPQMSPAPVAPLTFTFTSMMIANM